MNNRLNSLVLSAVTTTTTCSPSPEAVSQRVSEISQAAVTDINAVTEQAQQGNCIKLGDSNYVCKDSEGGIRFVTALYTETTDGKGTPSLCWVSTGHDQTFAAFIRNYNYQLVVQNGHSDFVCNSTEIDTCRTAGTTGHVTSDVWGVNTHDLCKATKNLKTALPQ